MKFDINKTLSLIKGGLLDHEATWKSYLDETPGWMQTAVVLTVPLLVTNIVLSLLFSRMVGGYAAYSWHSNWFMALVMGLILAAVGFTIAAFVFSFLAGKFKGKADFDRGFAALSLAVIPGWVAGPIAALVPYLGFLIALAGGLASLYFLYKIIPLALNVPQEKRVVHFIVSIIAVIVINMIIGLMAGAGQMNANRSGSYSSHDSTENPTFGSGTMGAIERQGRLMEDANSDKFEAPSDSELSKGQLKTYISVLRKTRAVQEDYAKEMQDKIAAIEAKEAAGEKPSMADMANVYASVGTGMSAMNAEMEVVKTGDGNWAEHQWVRTQLRNARIQQGEGSDALEHNYELYLQYEEELRELNALQ